MLTSVALLAALTLGPRPHVDATRINQGSAPTLDGVLDDAVWQRAPGNAVFTQKFPSEGAAPSERTTFRILYDDEAVYVGFECEQLHAPVVQRLTRRGRLVESDWVSVAFGTRGDQKSAFEFIVNASGVLVDTLRFNDTDTADNWDENWDARSSLTPHGWSAEFKLPLHILRFATAPEQSWDMQARRYVSEKQETNEWAFIPRSVAGEVSHYGKLDHLVGLTSKAPLEVLPFVVGKLQRRDAATTQLASGTSVTGSAGLDLKWHPTYDLTLDATFNPDFAQVEADRVVLNLTNFETYYPEKRHFFLEGIDTFTTPIQLVYTKRIGRAPAAPALRTNSPFGEQLVDVPTPATIYGASKLNGRFAKGWTIGTMQALTARNDVLVQLGDGSRVPRLADPMTSFNVLRLKRDVGKNGHVGLLTTAVTHLEPTSEYPVPGGSGAQAATQLCPSGTTAAPSSRCYNNAFVAGLDWRFRSETGAWVTSGQAVVSELQNGPPRVVRDGTVIRSGDRGAGIIGNVNKEGGANWVGDISGEYNDRKLDVNDLGFDRRANNYRWRVDLEYRELDPWWWMLESHARFEYFDRLNLDGLDIGSGYQLNLSGKFKNFWEFFSEVHYRGAYFDDREIGDGTALQRDGLVGYELEVTTDRTKRVAIEAVTQTQFLFDGFAANGSIGVVLRAMPQLDLEVLPTYVYTYGEPRFVGNGLAPGQLLFGRLDAKSFGTTLRATYTFTPRISFQTYAQIFLASGHYDDFSQYTANPTGGRPAIRLRDLQAYGGTLPSNPDFQDGVLNVNAILRWEYKLGSTVYLVYTRAQVPSVLLMPGERANLNFASVGRAPASDVILVKLTYWWG